MDNIEAAVLLAASHHAALVPLCDSYASDERKGVRLERIQQSKYFLEAVRQKAFQQYVPLERFEVFTGARVQRLFVLVDQLGCVEVLRVLRGRNGSLLDEQNNGAAHGDEMLPALSHLFPRAGIRLDISVARAHLPLATWTWAALRPAHATAASAQRACGPGSGLDRAC